MSLTERFLGGVERVGNKLPDPAFIFVWFIGALIIGSLIAAGLGAAAVNPVTGEAVAAQSLLSTENIRRLFVEMPHTLTSFAPLGYVLVVMLGAGVADRSGLFSTAMRVGVARAPKFLLTPAVIFIGILANHSADAAYVVLPPLAAAAFFAAGRHPIAGIAAAFAGVGGGFSANLFPGQLDALLLGLTEPAAQILDPSWKANIAGNWWFILVMAGLFTPIGWYVTDRIIEPRLGPWKPKGDQEAPAAPDAALEPEQRKGLARAGIAALVVVGAWIAMTALPGSPLINADAPAGERFTPFYRSLVAASFTLFLATGWAYGAAVGAIKGHRDIVRMMAGAMSDMSGYIVLAFVAAHFVAMINWSNLGVIAAISGAEGLKATGLPAPLLMMAIVVLAGLLNLVIGSASAKWAALGPVLVPMLMLLGVSPEMTTAAYRMGDSVTNIVTPLMVYFPLVLAFCQRWDPEFGIGNLMATMIPYAWFFLIAGLIVTGLWMGLALPIGPGETVFYALPDGGVVSR